MIKSAINNAQFWTAPLKVTVLVMILIIPVIYGDNNRVKVDQRQQSIVDQIIGDINEILE